MKRKILALLLSVMTIASTAVGVYGESAPDEKKSGRNCLLDNLE